MNTHFSTVSLAFVFFLASCAGQGNAASKGILVGSSHHTALAASAAPPPSLERFMKIRAPGSPTLASDGTLYVRDWPDGIRQLYRRKPGDAMDAPMHKLTNFPDGISTYTLSPDQSKIIISASIGGSEQDDLYLMNTRTDELSPLFTNPKVVYGFNHWLADSSGFIYSANDTVSADFHIYIYDFAAATSRKISDRAGSWSAADITADKKRVLLNQYIAANNAIAIEINLETGEETPIRVAAEQAYNAAAAYLPGEASCIFISDTDRGIRQAYVFDLANGATKKPLPSDLHKWEVEDGQINEDRSLVALNFNENGYSTLRLFSLPSFDELKLPLGEQGLYGSVGLRGHQLTYTLNNSQTPGITYTKGAFTRDMPRQLTVADTQNIDLSRFTLPTLVEYSSFDGLKIPAFLYLPPNYVKGDSIPFVANYHGGPEGQHRPGFDALTQYLLANGYGVIKPNVRGSSGYGREFLDMDNYKKRWDSVRDGVEAVRWLINEGYTAPGRVAAYGGSYGGFMAVATIIEGGAIYGASINVVGIVNFKTFLEQTKDYRRKLREVEYGPLTDPDFLESISPINRIDEIQVPMMIAHGLNDPRVPVGEAMQLAVGLQKRGYDPELLFFPDEGHGFAKLENRLLFAERAVRFLNQHLGEP